MHEEVLRDFFEGKITAAKLAADVAGSTDERAGKMVSKVFIADMDAEFTVTAAMAISLCDAVLNGELPADALRTIGFALMASDKFKWDGNEDEVLAEVIADWSAPEINYALTPENVARFSAWLTRTEPYPPKP